MNKLTIILDVDDVLIDTSLELRTRTNKKYGTNIQEKDIIDWDLTKIQPSGIDMLQFFKEKNFYDKLKPFPDVIYYLKKIIKMGHDVITLSASPLEGYEGKHILIKKYLPFIKEENIMFGTRKDLVHGDIMLDDAIHNIENSNCKYPIIFTKPWNVNYKEKNNLRVKNFKEFYEKVIEISNK